MEKCKRIYIWGAGDTAEVAFYFLHSSFHVRGVFDSDPDKQGTLFHGIPIMGFNPEERKIDEPIIIASIYWKEIAKHLIEFGLVPFRDFVLWHWLVDEIILYSEVYELIKMCQKAEKINYLNIIKELRVKKDQKACTFYGNCQTHSLAGILAACKPFCDDYFIIETPKVYHYNIISEREKTLFFTEDISFWEGLDLLIYQPVKRNNRFHENLSTENLLAKLRKDANKLSILNLHFMGYFPQCEWDKRVQTKNLKNNTFYDKYLLNYAEKYVCGGGGTTNNIKEFIENALHDLEQESFISKDEIYRNISASLNELEKREAFVDVKIVDYIKANYNVMQLFYSPRHPCNELLSEYARRIQNAIYKTNIDWELSDADVILRTGTLLPTGTLKGGDCSIYPAVISCLGLKKYEKLYCPNFYFDKQAYTFKEYSRKYLSMLIKGELFAVNRYGNQDEELVGENTLFDKEGDEVKQ